MALRFESRAEVKAEPSIKTTTPTQTIDLICELAKQKNKAELSRLISSGICIDIYDGTETATQRIVSEEKVDTEALEFLIKEFKANINDVVEVAACRGHVALVKDLIASGALLNDAVVGAARGGHCALVKDLIARGASINDAIGGAARGGHCALVKDLIASGALLNDAVVGAALGGHFALVEDLIGRGASLTLAVRGAALGGYLANETQALCLLASIQDITLRTEFALEAKLRDQTTFDMRPLVSKAKTLSDLSQTKTISFDQALAWQNTEVQGFLAFARAEKYLPLSLSFLIATFLSSHLTNGKEAKDLFEKMRFHMRKTDLSIDLQNCYLSSSRFALFRDSRPKKFKLVCQKTKSEAEIDQSIEQEIRANTKKDSYLDLLQSHTPRR